MAKLFENVYLHVNTAMKKQQSCSVVHSVENIKIIIQTSNIRLLHLYIEISLHTLSICSILDEKQSVGSVVLSVGGDL